MQRFIAPSRPTSANDGMGRVSGTRLLTFLLVAGIIAAAAFGAVHGPLRTLLLSQSSEAAQGVLTALSVLQLVIGLLVFRRAGGRLITPIGVYFLSTAVFLGYGGLAPAASKATVPYLAYASSTFLVFNLTVLAVALHLSEAAGLPRRKTPDEILRRGGHPSGVDSRSLTPYLVIWAALTAGSGLLRSVPIIGGFANVIHGGIGLLLLQAFLGQRRRNTPVRLMLGVPAVLALSVGSFIVTYYTGFARIITGGFLIASATLVNRRYPTLPLKTIVIVGMIPGLILAGSGDRTGLTFREAAAGIGEARGIGSATGVVPVLAMTLAEYDSAGLNAYAHRNGRTFLVSALHWIPREWWPSKPNSVEIELAQLLYPEVQFGYSIVGSNTVEWLLNFDLLGLIPGALITGVALAATERWARARPRRRRALPHDVVLRALVTGNITIYAWAGSFSFAARTFTPFIIILALRRLATVGGRAATSTPSDAGR
jgi:hypothetical protein